MRRTSLKVAGALALGFAMLATVLLPACSVNVKKEQNGEDKQVDISTPVGGIHVSKDASAADTGLPIYPGARLKQKDGGGDKNANVNISGFGYGVKVVALEYESDDSPAKLVAFYKEQLKKYGEKVLECRTTGDLDVNMDYDDDSGRTTRVRGCVGSSGNNTELRVGARENQHIVAVEPEGKGSSFSLVYVRTHGKDTEI